VAPYRFHYLRRVNPEISFLTAGQLDDFRSAIRLDSSYSP
jgi:hypothetical protein